MATNTPYYYIVSGLPELELNQRKITIPIEDHLSEWREMLLPEDFHSISLLLLPHDNQNLVNLVVKKAAHWVPFGNFDHDTLENALKQPFDLPPYMQEFIASFRENQTLYPDLSWEDQLTALYFDHVLEQTEGFLHQWFEFELHLRNFLTAFQARKYDHPLKNHLIGNNEITQKLLSSHAQDFGLSKQLFFVEKVMTLLNQDNNLEKERGLDEIRWSFIDELNTFNYFNIENIQGFLIKLLILERWSHLDAEKGGQQFKKLVDYLEHSIEFPNEFSAI